MTVEDKGQFSWDSAISVAHLIWVLGGALLAIGMTYASISQRLNYIENKVPQMERDHDLLISIAANVESVKKDINDIKCSLSGTGRSQKP